MNTNVPSNPVSQPFGAVTRKAGGKPGQTKEK